MDIQVNKPKITRVWFPLRVFQLDLNSTTTGKLVTLGFGQKCVVVVRQGGLSGSLPTVTFTSLKHATQQWRISVLELIETHMISKGIIEDMSDVRKAEFIESLLTRHGIQSRPVDVLHNFKNEVALAAQVSDEPEIDND